MPSMDNLIAEYYAQNDSADSDVEKQAQVELFAKLAADNGIDLEQLSEDQIGYLWNETFKTAAEESKKDEHEEHESASEEHEEEKKKDEAEKKAEAAYLEYEEKRAAAAKVAEADFLGRYMAHAMTDEIQKIAMSGAEAGARLRDLGSRAGKKLKEVAHDVGDIATAKQLREGLRGKENIESAAGHAMLGRHVMKNVPQGAREEAMKGMKQDALDAAQKNIRHGAAKTVALYGTAGGTAALAGKALHDRSKGHSKKASAIDEIAAEVAVEKAASAGWDAEEAADRLTSVLTLGIGESEKVAFAQDLEGAVDVRSLELLEAAGYPVTWND